MDIMVFIILVSSVCIASLFVSILRSVNSFDFACHNRAADQSREHITTYLAILASLNEEQKEGFHRLKGTQSYYY
jgi:hypothetical protein